MSETLSGSITHLGLTDNEKSANTIGFHVVTDPSVNPYDLDERPKWTIEGVREPVKVKVNPNCKAVRQPDALGTQAEFANQHGSELKLANPLPICVECQLNDCAIHPENFGDQEN